MYNPSRDQARQFFIDAWSKHKSNAALTALETIALEWMLQHPEYHPDLDNPQALDADYSVERGRTNPFLHLAMHLAIAEQLSIDHPHGIRAVYQTLAARSSEHQAAHEMMECLGQIVWESQRLGVSLNSDAYIELLRQRAG